MQTPLFPIPFLLLAASSDDAIDPLEAVSIAEKYGPIGIAALAMGALAFWQNRQMAANQKADHDRRAERDAFDRQERKEERDALIKVIEDQRHVNDANAAWMRSQIEK